MTPHPARYARHPLPQGPPGRGPDSKDGITAAVAERDRVRGLLLAMLAKNLTQEAKFQTSSLLARLAPRPFDNQFRMVAPERLRDMAIPANGGVLRKDLRQPLRTNLVPLHSLPVRVEQSRALPA